MKRLLQGGSRAGWIQAVEAVQGQGREGEELPAAPGAPGQQLPAAWDRLHGLLLSAWGSRRAAGLPPFHPPLLSFILCCSSNTKLEHAKPELCH